MASASAQVAEGGAAGAAGTVQLDDIVVQGERGQPPASGTVGQPPRPYAGGQVGSGARLGMLGNRSVLETPFNITSFTEKLARDQQARSIADIALNDPSVRADAPAFSERDSFFIRGFSVTNLDTLYDGLPYIANPRRSFLEGIERVEILKGPTSLVNGGVGRVGGAINLVPKRAYDEPLTRLTTGFMSDSQVWTHLDFGRRFGEQKEWGLRFNGSYRNGGTAFDHNDTEVGVAALGLDYRGERFRAAIDLNHSTQNLDGPTSLFNTVFGGNAARPPAKVPRAPNGKINTANPWEFHDSEYNMVAGRMEFDILPETTVYLAGGASRYREDFLTTSYTIGDPRLGPNPGKGDAFADFGYNPQEIKGFAGEVGLRSEFDTGPVGHQLSVSAARAFNENNRGRFHPRVIPGLGLPAYPTNIYDPSYVPDNASAIDGLPDSSDLHKFADLLLTSVAVSDTLSFLGDRFQLTLGGRYQELRSRGYNVRPGIPTAPVGARNYFYKDDRFSPAVAALARVTDNFSVYANYVEALTEGPTAPATGVSNPGQAFPPSVNKQKEVGFKYDFGAFALTTSLFEIKQPSAFVDGGRFVSSGEQVNRGLEFTVFGEPVEGVRVIGGVTFLDAELKNVAIDNRGNNNDGNRAPGVPRTTVSLYGEYDLPWIIGASLNGRVVYGGKTYLNAANTQRVEDWTRFDLGARYAFTGLWDKPMVIRANVQNVFDKAYWASSARGFLAVGAPRTFTLSASVDF